MVALAPAPLADTNCGMNPELNAYLQRRAERVDALRARLSQLRAEMGQPVVLEFGCGHGHFLTDYAQSYATQACLGIDIVRRRIWLANRKAARSGLTLLHFELAEAFELLEAWPTGWGIRRVFMLFPDPWPKKRHHKNRMLNQRLLDMLSLHTSPGTPFHFRTDHSGYYQAALDLATTHPAWVADLGAEWPFERETIFQQRMETWNSLTLVRCL
jgi:tRNA (guanine-N7-)-methyltransferase